MSNAYFRVIMDNKGIEVEFTPAKDGGEQLKIDEVMKYLEKEKITDYDLVELNKALMASNDSVTRVPIFSEKKFAINETMILRTAKEDMFAVVRFYPPSTGGGTRMTKDELIKDLEYHGIKYGIDEKMIDAFIANPQYCTNYIIARGKPVVQGKDASIEYHFNTDRKAKPRRSEDGSVNFHLLDNISHIKKGDILATLTPEDTGIDGMTVKGVTIKPRTVNKLKLSHGMNITISEDGLTMISDVNGHAVLEGDKVFVSNVYDVPADVDNATGDILYEGNVFVRGNVRTGFKIEATGDVEILGAVEGATIKAGGQIVLHHGMQGMGRGILEAGDNIIAKFIESSTVKAGGFIESDTIIQSKISAKGDIVVNGSKGFIIGGTVSSATLVSAKTIGSTMGIATIIEVGTDPALKERLGEKTEELKKLNTELKQTGAIVEMFRKKKELGTLDKSKLPLYIKSVENFENINTAITDINKELEQLVQQIGEYEHACIKVNQDIFPGVRVIVSDEHMVINQSLSHCKFVKERGLIKVLPL